MQVPECIDCGTQFKPNSDIENHMQRCHLVEKGHEREHVRLVDAHKDLQTKIKEHNQRIESAFARAKKGEVINLTDLMISKENIDEDAYEVEKNE